MRKVNLNPLVCSQILVMFGDELGLTHGLITAIHVSHVNDRKKLFCFNSSIMNIEKLSLDFRESHKKETV